MTTMIEPTRPKSIRDRVRHILDEHPEARNNDNYLCAMYWNTFENVMYLSDITEGTSVGAIIRARQYINQKNLYLPTEKDVMEKRNKMKKVK